MLLLDVYDAKISESLADFVWEFELVFVGRQDLLQRFGRLECLQNGNLKRITWIVATLENISHDRAEVVDTACVAFQLRISP